MTSPTSLRTIADVERDPVNEREYGKPKYEGAGTTRTYPAATPLMDRECSRRVHRGVSDRCSEVAGTPRLRAAKDAKNAKKKLVDERLAFLVSLAAPPRAHETRRARMHELVGAETAMTRLTRRWSGSTVEQ